MYQLATTWAALLLAVTSVFSQSAFINEINYLADDPRAGVELLGRAGSDLNGWSLVFYNVDGVATQAFDLSDRTLPNQGNGYGAIWMEVSQGGEGGALALVSNAGSVVQFLAYGAARDLTARNGAAAGQDADYIGTQLDGLLPLALKGTGLTALDFIWWNLPASPGTINPLQYIGLPTLWGKSASNSLQEEAELSVFPIPTTDWVTVRWMNSEQLPASLNLLSVDGRIVRSFATGGASEVALNLGDVSEGMYLLQMGQHRTVRLQVRR